MTIHVGHCRRRQTWPSVLGLALFMSLALAPVQALAKQFVSVAASASCPAANQTGTVHKTVQAAVDGAIAAGDRVIEICPGTYRGPITVTGLGTLERLDIRGVGADDDATQVRITGTPGTPGPIIDVTNAATVDIKNLTVDGESLMAPDTPGGEVIGIQYAGASGLLDNVIVQNIRDASGSAVGIGVAGRGLNDNGAGPPEEQLLRLVRVTISNVTGVGILADGSGITLAVDETLVVGPVEPLVLAPYGVQVSRGAKGTVEHSHLTNFRSPAPTQGAGAAIVFLCPAVNSGEVAIARHNTVRDADLGVSLIDSDGVRVANNTIIDAQIGVSVQSWRTTNGCLLPTVPAQNSHIVDNLILDATQAGVALTSLDTNGSVPQSNTIAGNSIYTDVDIAMAPILVTDGENKQFLAECHLRGADLGDCGFDNWGGTSGTANVYDTNRCFGIGASAFCVR